MRLLCYCCKRELLKDDNNMSKVKKASAFTAGFMVAATLTAKLCGMLRDILMANLYGTSTDAAMAFSAASRIPLLFFDIALGSAVTSAFIPVFNEYIAKGKEDKAFDVLNMSGYNIK